MRSIKVLSAFIILFFIASSVVAQNQASLNYAITNPRTLNAGGGAGSTQYLIDNVVIGATFGGTGTSANYSLNATEGILGLNPPSVDFTGVPTASPTPHTVGFNNHTTGDVTGYHWDFGDGGMSTAENPIHTYYLSDAEMNYEADALPGNSDAGWVVWNEWGTPMIETIESGIYRLKIDFVYGGVLYSRGIGFTKDKEYVIETRFKLGDFKDAVHYCAMSMHVRDDKYSYRLNFTDYGISVMYSATSLGSYSMDTQSDYHDYKMVADDGIVKVYVDGVLRIRADARMSGDFPPPPSMAQRITIGPAVYVGASVPYGTYYAEGYWDYIRAYAADTPPSEKRYTVTLTASGSGGVGSKTKTDYIRVTSLPAPVAQFTCTPTSGGTPLEVQFTNQSTGEVYGYLWDFGDGYASPSENPSHTYFQTGTFAVTLKAIGPGGTDVETKTGLITVTIPPPHISSIEPSNAVKGELVIIKGLNFGYVQGNSYIIFYPNIICRDPYPWYPWSNSLIYCYVPYETQTGPVVVVTDGGTSNAVNLTIVLPPIIATTTLADGATGWDYEAYLSAIDGTPPYSWAFDYGTLPPGLSLDATGKISGVPTSEGTFNFVVIVTDSFGKTAVKELSIYIARGLTDLELLDKTQAESALFFYNEVLSNGLIKDGDHKGFSSIAATGFGLASLCVVAERHGTSSYWTVTPAEARARANQILDTCLAIQGAQASNPNEYGIAGFLYHFIDADNTRNGTCEVSSIDTAILLAGAIVAGEYFGGEVKTKVDQFYNNIDWGYFIVPAKKQFSHGWKPETGLYPDTWDRPGDETMLISLLAIGSDPNNNTLLETMFSWPRVYRSYAGYNLVSSYFGSLFTYFFAHCFYDFENMGYDDPSVIGSNAPSVDWWDNSVKATYAARQFCIDKSDEYSSYGPDSWGFTACEHPSGTGYEGLLGAAPCEANSGTPYHNGIIAPYGAISSMPLMRTSDTEVLTDNLAFNALKYFYRTYKNELWGVYGPRDSFNHSGQFSPHYLGIDVGPQVLMIENYRSDLIWSKFMANSAVQATVDKIFGASAPPTPTIYVDIANADDPNEDGSEAHPFDTIQEGIDAAANSDVIFVAGGTYVDQAIHLNKSGITLLGEQRSTIVKGKGTGSGSPVIYCENISGDQTVIKGFKITLGANGIQCAGSVSSLKIENNLIQSTYWGVYLENGASCEIKNNDIWDTPTMYGAGNNTVTFTGNTITNTLGPNHPGVYLYGANALIEDSEFISCWGGAISLYNNSDADIINNAIKSCYGWNTCAGVKVYSSTADIFNNILSHNLVHSSTTSGVAVYANNGTVSLCNNVFYRNRGPNVNMRGVCINASNTSLVAKNNIYTDNYNGQELVYVASGGTADFSYNDLWSNSTTTDLTGLTPGPGNISGNPLFVDYVDYRLQASSPCIDAGDPAAQYNDTDGTRNDMGIYGGPDSF